MRHKLKDMLSTMRSRAAAEHSPSRRSFLGAAAAAPLAASSAAADMKKFVDGRLSTYASASLSGSEVGYASVSRDNDRTMREKKIHDFIQAHGYHELFEEQDRLGSKVDGILDPDLQSFQSMSWSRKALAQRDRNMKRAREWRINSYKRHTAREAFLKFLGVAYF